MARAGYDPREAAALWNGAIQEERADERAPRVPMFATHPPSAERWLALRERAIGLVTPENDRKTCAQSFDEAVRRFRASLLSDEVAMRKHARTSLLIDRLLQAEILSPGDAAFYHGELYRVRDEPGDVERAIACYREAIAFGQVLPVAYRSLGLLLRRVGDREGAREAFLRYRELAPEASDRAMIDAYLADLG
jgi:tetratricopeptide (TPR) repeat protein